MKIVISGYVGKKITGIGRNLINLLNNAKGGTEFIIYTNEDMKDDFVFQNPNVTVKTYGVSKNDSLKNLLWTTFVFPFVVLKEKADRALIPNFTLLLFKFKPTFVIMHDLIEFNVPDKFSKKKMFYRTKLADPITAKMANRIITVSQNSKRDIMKFLGVQQQKIKVIYNGVDQEKFKRMDKEQAEAIITQKGWPVHFLLYAGTIDHPGKNAMGVIKAFEKLRENNEYNGSLILAGMKGSGYEIVKNHVNHSKYKENIIFTGYVTDEELIALYSRCDVFCFLSLYEGFGIPPLEALACGAKVVTSNTSSLPEVVGDVGWTVDPSDNDAVYNQVLVALNADSSIDMDTIVQKHLQNYQWSKLGEKLEAILCQKGKHS